MHKYKASMHKDATSMHKDKASMHKDIDSMYLYVRKSHLNSTSLLFLVGLLAQAGNKIVKEQYSVQIPVMFHNN